jgi:hypothetical protein
MLKAVDMQNKAALTILLFFVACLAAGGWHGRSAASEVAVIRLKYSWAAEVLPIVQSMLSPAGTVTVSERINSLVIVDDPDAIGRVRAYLDQFDRPVEQVRIHVRFHEKRSDTSDAVAGRAKVSGDSWGASAGGKKKDGVDLALEERRRRQTNSAEYFVFATAGRPAFIRAGQEIPYRANWPDYTRRYASRGDAVVFQTVETGFDVTPTVAGENVHLRIVPRIAYGDQEEAIIRYYGAQTELTVPLGRWVEIGGSNTQSNEVIEEILSRGGREQRASMVMSLMVEKP